jgi:hypothetical protein
MSDILLWNIIEISTYLFETIIIYTFLRDFLGKKTIPAFIKIISPFVSFILLVTIHIITANTTLIISCILLVVFLTAFLFDGGLKHKLLASLLLVAFMLGSEILTMVGIMALSMVSAQIAIEQGVLRLIGILISKIILLILTKIVLLLKKKRTDIRIPISYWLALFSVPLISIVVVYAIFSFNMLVGYSPLTIMAVVSAIGLMFSDITIFYLFDAITEKAVIKNKYNILERQIESQVMQYEAMEFSNKNIRKIKHDMNNHLLCIQSLINNESSEASNYVSTLYKTLNNHVKELDTGNYIIDSLLNAKIAMAEVCGIKVNKRIQIPIGLKIDDVDSCILLGNALDNAIEACNRISDGNKEIKISFIKNQNALIFVIKNTTDGKLKRNGQLFYSSKRSPETIGIGLENIYNTVRKYNGIVSVKHENNIFELSFMLQGV